MATNRTVALVHNIMRLFRLHPLASDDHVNWIEETVRTGRFHCSNFADLNDPMEGVFTTNSNTNLSKLTSNKIQFKICCFTDIYGVKNPSLWGYYAGSFRGVAIEVMCNDEEVYSVDYVKTIPNITDTNHDSLIIALKSKLVPWKHEREYRFLKSCNDVTNNIGKIVAIHCFIPYYNVENSIDIWNQSSAIRSYISRLQCLKNYIDGRVPIYVAKFDCDRNKIIRTETIFAQ